jgi:NRAMP (natural resistance-associated macrophage protein)-like metal ion transporter
LRKNRWGLTGRFRVRPPASSPAREPRPAARRAKHPLSRWLSIIGPGFITGASDDDPSGIGTYAAAGSAFGYATLWTALVTYPLMAAVQLICARIGMVTGNGLITDLRRRYSRPVLSVVVLALFAANTLNAGADLEAIVDALRLIVRVPVMPATVIVAAVILALQIFGSYELICRIFKWLALSLLAYVGSAWLSHPEIGAVLRGTFVPTLRFDRDFVAMLVALFGTTISPYLFFWETDQEVEEQAAASSHHHEAPMRGAEAMRRRAIDVNVGMLFSNLVMYFVIFATAATLHRSGTTHIESAAQAAQALRPLAGNAASLLLAIGLIGSGMLAVPVLTGSAAYAVAELFGWRSGLSAKPRQALPFYGVIVVSTGLGLLIHATHVKPYDALVGAAIVNGVLAPPMLFLIMRMSRSRDVMGERVNGPLLNVLGWSAMALMSLAAIALLVTSLR